MPRAIIMGAGGSVVFIHLAGSRALIETRMSGREGHFMPTSLLDSRFADLEPLTGDEAGFRVDISMSLNEIAEDAKAQLEGMTEWRRA